MSVIPMKALLESGVHFGHRTHKWDPGMKPYIFTERNGIHIIDLQKTVKALDQAYNIVRDSVGAGGTVLFVGTKRQAQETIQMEATRSAMPSVTVRWLGGMLTNWRTIRQRINELERLERMRDRGEFERLTKKEALNLNRQIERLDMLLGGIRSMARLPELLFVVDVHREQTAIHEANLLNIPVIAMVDTNCNPNNIDYVIPSNDDAIRAIKLLVSKMADAVLEGKAMRKEEEIPVPLAEGDTTLAGVDVLAGLEEDVEDEKLLGKATRAKLASTKPEVEEVVAPVEVKEISVEPEVVPVEAKKKEVTPEPAKEPVKEKKAEKAENKEKEDKKEKKVKKTVKKETGE